MIGIITFLVEGFFLVFVFSSVGVLRKLYMDKYIFIHT